MYLNLVMEYIPETIHRTLRNHTKAKKLVPIMYTKASLASEWFRVQFSVGPR